MCPCFWCLAVDRKPLVVWLVLAGIVVITKHEVDGWYIFLDQRGIFSWFRHPVSGACDPGSGRCFLCRVAGVVWSGESLTNQVLFPQDVPKIIFIDADQVPRCSWGSHVMATLKGCPNLPMVVPLGTTVSNQEDWFLGVSQRHFSSLSLRFHTMISPGCGANRTEDKGAMHFRQVAHGCPWLLVKHAESHMSSELQEPCMYFV